MNTVTASKLEQKIPLFLGLLLGAFFLAKFVNLYTPLFHDELGVYGRALFYMLDNGPSMIPGDVDPEISRGHPLFFAFFISSLSAWLGSTYVSARLVSLLCSLVLLIATYFLGKELFSKKIGLFAAFVLAFQPLFFAQSTLILPEILLSLLATLSLLFYTRKSFWLYFIFASLMMMTKETALVIFSGIALYEWYLNKFKITFKLILEVAKWSTPILWFVLFLVVQNHQHGWYLYPYHTGFVSFSPFSVFIRTLVTVTTLFLGQGRFILGIAIIAIYLKLDKEKRQQVLHENALIIAILIPMLVFSALNYFMTRYLLIILPIVIINALSVIEIRNIQPKHIAIFFLLTLPFQFNPFYFTTDNNMGYLIVVNNIKKSAAALDSVSQGKAVRVFVEFPEINAIEDPRNGYTTNPNYILTTKYDNEVDYILKSGDDHMEVDGYNIALEDYINPTDYGLDTTINSTINNTQALKKSKFELIFESKYFFNHQRLFKTNNSVSSNE